MRRKRELMKSNLSTRFYCEMHYKIESKGNDRDEKIFEQRLEQRDL